jgi:hypothetical protein
MSNETVKINSTIMWAFLDKKDTSFNPEETAKYQVDLCFLSEAAVAKLESIGVNVREKQDKGSFITCKSKYVINAYDTDGNTLVGSDRDSGKALEGNVKVGNGSTATATLSTYGYTTPAGKKGTNATIKRLCITDLIEFVSEGSVDEDADMDAL